jgi:hypothetical protein
MEVHKVATIIHILMIDIKINGGNSMILEYLKHLKKKYSKTLMEDLDGKVHIGLCMLIKK